MRPRTARPRVPSVSNPPRHSHHHVTAVRLPVTSVPHTRPVTTRPGFTVSGGRNRRYAAVLSRLSNQSGPRLRSSSSAFSGYVPKCKQNRTVEHKDVAVKSVSYGTPERKTKVSFCLQPSRDDARWEDKTTAVPFKSAVSLPSSSAASVTTVTCSEAVISTAGLPSSNIVGSVTGVPCVEVPADSSDVSLLCAELFVDNNASFCDQLLESFAGSCEQSDVPHILPSISSSNLKQDIPEPVTDFTFDDFVEFDDFFSYS